MHDPYLSNIDIAKPAYLGGGHWRLSNLTTITTIFGKNGSGKSLLLRAWRDTNPSSYHYVVPERSGNLQYNAGLLSQQGDPNQRRSASAQNFTEQYRQQIIARIQTFFMVRGAIRENKLPGNIEDIEMLLSQLLPDFSMTLIGGTAQPYELIRTSDNSTVGSIEQLSSGEAQLLTLALDILTIAAIWDIQGEETRIVLIDEPDAHIHPDLQVRFADFLIQVVTRYRLQVVIATHSTTLLAAIGQFGANAASVLYLDRTKSDFPAAPFSTVMKELAACLGGHALMGPLFSVPLLLVEGDDDYRIWSQVPRHHVTSFAVIPSHGDEIKRYQRTLERLFVAICEVPEEPAGFALIDGDKPKPLNNESTPQNHVRFIQLECHESENLYLTDEVLASMDTTWEEAVARIVAEAGKFGNKAEELEGAADWDRQTVDIKNLIQEISNILDPKNVHWTIRVGAMLGRSYPTGQIRNFLGDAVVSSLWRSEPEEELPS